MHQHQHQHQQQFHTARCPLPAASTSPSVLLASHTQMEHWRAHAHRHLQDIPAVVRASLADAFPHGIPGVDPRAVLHTLDHLCAQLSASPWYPKTCPLDNVRTLPLGELDLAAGCWARAGTVVVCAPPRAPPTRHPVAWVESAPLNIDHACDQPPFALLAPRGATESLHFEEVPVLDHELARSDRHLLQATGAQLEGWQLHLPLPHSEYVLGEAVTQNVQLPFGVTPFWALRFRLTHAWVTTAACTWMATTPLAHGHPLPVQLAAVAASLQPKAGAGAGSGSHPHPPLLPLLLGHVVVQAPAGCRVHSTLHVLPMDGRICTGFAHSVPFLNNQAWTATFVPVGCAVRLEGGLVRGSQLAALEVLLTPPAAGGHAGDHRPGDLFVPWLPPQGVRFWSPPGSASGTLHQLLPPVVPPTMPNTLLPYSQHHRPPAMATSAIIAIARAWGALGADAAAASTLALSLAHQEICVPTSEDGTTQRARIIATVTGRKHGTMRFVLLHQTVVTQTVPSGGADPTLPPRRPTSTFTCLPVEDAATPGAPPTRNRMLLLLLPDWKHGARLLTTTEGSLPVSPITQSVWLLNVLECEPANGATAATTPDVSSASNMCMEREAGTGTGTETETGTGAEAEAGPKAKAKTKERPEPESKLGLDPGLDPGSGFDSDFEPALQLDPEPDPEPTLDPVFQLGATELLRRAVAPTTPPTDRAAFVAQHEIQHADLWKRAWLIGEPPSRWAPEDQTKGCCAAV